MALRLIRGLPGEPSSVATVIPEKLVSQELCASFGRRNDTILPYACATRVKRSTRVHRILPRVRDDRERPSVGTGREGI